MDTREVKIILNKLKRAGVIWLCFTGGDPLTRSDFAEIYSYARRSGFIVTVFTSGYSINNRIIRYLKRYPPFAIELTLNAVNQNIFERITRVKGSFLRVFRGIDLLLSSGLPLKIKTQVTRDNLRELPGIKGYLKKINLSFSPNHILYPRLNSDPAPCSLRIPADSVLELYGTRRKGFDVRVNSEAPASLRQRQAGKLRESDHRLYRCAISSGNGIYVDPYGNMFLCNLIRQPKVNLLNTDIGNGLKGILSDIAGDKFNTDSRCRDCGLRRLCGWCPGKAYLERGNKERPIPYYCKLSRMIKKYEI